MIIYLLLKSIMIILELVAGIFGNLIPKFPSAVSSVLTTISSMIQSGIAFLSYFFSIPVLVALISLVIAWHSFRIVKDAIMKVIGHFIAT